MLSKFINKSAQKISIFSSKASYARGLFYLLLFLTCCKSPPKKKVPTVIQGTVMTIPYKVIIGNSFSIKEDLQAREIIKGVFEEINQIHNKWNPESELSKLNKLKANEKILLSPQLESLLLLTDQVYQLSGHRFDPTVETVQKLWREKLNHKLIPNEEELKSFSEALGWHHIHIDNHYFWKDHVWTQLDLSGIAKGFAVDLLVERLINAGHADVFVEWGGEIRSAGKHPDSRPWNIFISRLGDPDPEHAVAILSLHDQAIATSGDYEQHWTVNLNDGTQEQFFHIIDPKTGAPCKIRANGITSASVLAPTCALADGLATTALLFDSLSDAKEWSEQLTLQFPSLSFWLIAHDNVEYILDDSNFNF